MPSVGSIWIPEWELIPASGTIGWATQSTINAVNEKAGYILRVPKSGTLHSFEMIFGTSSLAGTLQYSFQNVDSNGMPDDTVDQFRNVTSGWSTNTWFTLPGPITDDGTDSGVKRTVTRGDLLACVIHCTVYTSGGNNIIALSNNNAWHTVFPYYVFEAGIGWQKDDTDIPNFALKYNDGTYAFIPYVSPIIFNTNTHTINTATSPDEVAMKFVPDVTMTISGFKVLVDADNAFDVILYDSSNSVLTSFSHVAGQRGATNNRIMAIPFPADVTVTAGQTYRLAFKPTTGSSISLYSENVPTSSHMSVMPGGSAYIYSSRSDAGSWTDLNDRRLIASLWVTAISTGGGSVLAVNVHDAAKGF